jgi:hypothetical protein
MKRSLTGAPVQRAALAQVGAREVAVLQVRVPGETVHLVVASGLGVGVVGDDARSRLRAALGVAALPAQPYWRARLDGARVAEIGPRAIDVVRGETRLRLRDAATSLRLEPGAAGGDDAGPPTSTPPGAGDAPSEELDALVARGTRILDALERAGAGGRHDALRRALGKAIAKIERRAAAVSGDLAEIARTEAAAESARLFVAEAARAPRGATALRALDWSRIGPDGAPEAVEMALDPAKGAKEQIDALFRRARRMKEGARVASVRRADAIGSRDRLVALRDKLAAAPEALDLDAIEAEARRAAPRDFKLSAGPIAAPRRAASDARPPYRAFVGHGQMPLYVGRGAAQNDELTLHVARPHDLWLHAKEHPGAHVVVPLAKGRSCPPETLVDAAHLAAHFSDARGERVVEIQYTPRRYLRKPRGSAKGAVIVDREKVLVLRVDDARLQRLLNTEVDG